MNADEGGKLRGETAAEELKLTPGAGCTVLKRKSIQLMHSFDNELVIYHARILLNEAGFSKTDEYILAAAASELATNIIRYAKEGELVISLITAGENRKGIEFFAGDRGPGIRDIEAAMSEHFSSEKSSLGLGLPSVKRIMDEFYIESIVGMGTRVQARKWRDYAQN